jgi:hypothetical protein
MKEHLFIVDLMGGLGNQLFQVAFGLYLKRLHQSAQIRFDTSYYRRDSRHGGLLAHLLLRGLEPTFVELGPGRSGTALIDLSEQPASFCSWLQSVPPPARIRGYFQNWRYVSPVLKSMQNASRVETLASKSPDHQRLLKDETVHTIGVHIRRGDYLIPSVRQHIGVVDLESIRSQVEKIVDGQARAGKRCEALVFSDVQPEQLTDLALPCQHQYVNLGLADKRQEDLMQFALLAGCTSIVCSNSTFSYWAGLLGHSTAEGRLFLPERWMKKSLIETSDIMPPGSATYPNMLS